MKKETKFGLGQIGNHSPKWATWFFRIVLYICTLVTLALTTLNLNAFGFNITPEQSNETIKLMAFITLAAHALSRMFGIEVKKEDYEIN